jgi:glycosyltransferase involved in cell wall biosynthesis
MDISVVIPTCNRKRRLLSVLGNLNSSSYPISEVIIVDSGEDKLLADEYATFNLKIVYLTSEKSVCVQRNIGIGNATAEWVFVCDDDIEAPSDYLEKLTAHIKTHNEAGAVSGLVFQKEGTSWQAEYPVNKATQLLWNFIFQLSIWGEIDNSLNKSLLKKISRYYQRKGNHISKAGWPVITDFSNDYFISPVYGLGASLVRKTWLINSPYDEVLDRHGIGDNYGVAAGFPSGIHVLNTAFVYHHQEPGNRLQRSLQYYRRTLALDYFRKTKKSLTHIKKFWLLWSLTGNLLAFIFARDGAMVDATLKSILKIFLGTNPYYKAAKKKERVVEPVL